MKRFYHVFVIFFIGYLSLVSCDKDGTQDVTTLSGQAFYVDLLQIDSTALVKQTIEAKDMKRGYVYPLTTDEKGMFLFPGLLNGDSIQLTYKTTRNDSSTWQGVYGFNSIFIAGRAGNLILKAIIDTLHYNTVLINTTDTAGGLMQYVDVWGYLSGEMARTDTGFKGIGATFHLKSSVRGQGLAMQLPAAPLYIRSQFTADTGKIIFRNNIDTVMVRPFIQKNIKLVKK